MKRGYINALVGETGCGKSTIVNLIYQLWKPNSGKILIDGINIQECEINSLRGKICIVGQDVLILNDQIYNNIIVNQNNINIKDGEALFEKLEIDQLISCHEDRAVGEDGVNISGGQKQKIAIARALLNAYDVIIFDEATSALDNISQQKLLTIIKPFINNKIVLFIAHRLETIKEADEIFVMREGHIVESGSHKELIKKRGDYFKMVTVRYNDKQGGCNEDR